MGQVNLAWKDSFSVHVEAPFPRVKENAGPTRSSIQDDSAFRRIRLVGIQFWGKKWGESRSLDVVE